MSEYQYYEFQAIDRPLSEAEIRVLRSFSSRARITPTSFVNDYEWGNFKGDENAWMEKYFDAFFYTANWGCRTFMLRLPSTLLDLKTARRYCLGEGASVHEKKDKIVLTFEVEGVEDDGLDMGETWLSSLVPLRADIARGDLRALYLGWLHLVESGSLDSGVTEPAVPAGLGQLSASLNCLAEFLSLGPDLVSAAAQASEHLGNTLRKPREIRARVAKLPSAAKDDLLTELFGGQGGSSATPILQEFAKTHNLGIRPFENSAKRRTVRQLLQVANGENRRAANVSHKHAGKGHV